MKLEKKDKMTLKLLSIMAVFCAMGGVILAFLGYHTLGALFLIKGVLWIIVMILVGYLIILKHYLKKLVKNKEEN